MWEECSVNDWDTNIVFITHHSHLFARIIFGGQYSNRNQKKLLLYHFCFFIFFKLYICYICNFTVNIGHFSSIFIFHISYLSKFNSRYLIKYNRVTETVWNIMVCTEPRLGLESGSMIRKRDKIGFSVHSIYSFSLCHPTLLPNSLPPAKYNSQL